MIIKTRKKQLKKKIINNKNIQYNFLIIKLLEKKSLDNLITQITNTKVKLEITSLTKKNYLTANEQFLSLLNNFIYIFKENFYFLNTNIDYIIELLLQNEKHTKFLLSKRYIGDNNNLTYYSQNIKKLIVSGFYYNIRKLSKKSDIINLFIKEKKINTRKNLLNSQKGLDILYNSLLDLAICNAKTTNNSLLFESINHYINLTNQKYNNLNANNKEIIYDHYIKQWELMINNYNLKKDATNLLLK